MYYFLKLRVLNAKRCPVTDQGIERLCGGSKIQKQGQKIQRLGHCKAIHTLKIQDTQVTHTGIKFALENLPALKFFDFDSPIRFLVQLHDGCNCRNFPPPSSGEVRPACVLPFKIESRGLVSPFCTFLNAKTNSGWLHKLAHMENRSFHLKKSFGRLNFDGDFNFVKMLALKDLGCSLTFLKIVDNYSPVLINIRTIVEYCPKLENLSFENGGTFIVDPLQVERTKKEPILENLKNFAFSDNPEWRMETDRVFPREGFELLLSSPTLEYVGIDFHGCRNQTLDDRILKRASDLHGFKSLQFLLFTCCCFVTKECVISLFFHERNALHYFRIDNCPHFAEEDADEFINLAREKNWKLDIDFCRRQR